MSSEISYRVIILVLSVLIPLAVGLLLFMPEKVTTEGNWNLLLPHVHGILNAITTLVLLFGYIMIRNKNITWHKSAMSIAFALGVIFLVSYLIYHSTSESTIFGDVNGDGMLDEQEKALTGSARGIYLFILLSHILLAVIVVPLVLFAFYFALTDKIVKHKKIVRFTLPVWMYVSVTGVLVYLMIRPYY